MNYSQILFSRVGYCQLSDVKLYHMFIPIHMYRNNISNCGMFTVTYITETRHPNRLMTTTANSCNSTFIDTGDLC